MSRFCNTLRKDDEVAHAKNGRRGVVAMQPRETSLKAMVLWDSCTVARAVPVEDLRFVVNGIAEDVPPFDGELPWRQKGSPAARVDQPGQKFLLVYSEGKSGSNTMEIPAGGFAAAIQEFCIDHGESSLISIVRLH